MFVGLARNVRAQTADSAQVVDAVATMLRALYQKDSLTLQATMDSSARMSLLRPGPNGEVRVVVMSGAQFIRATTAPNGQPLDEPLRNLRVQIHQDLATVWAEYQVRSGGQVTHCGFDAFQLVRRGGRWRILNVSDTFQQQGCGPVWPDAPIFPSRPPNGKL